MIRLGIGVGGWAPAAGGAPVSNPNLLTFTEQFDNAAWTALATATVSANDAADPLAGMTADTITSPGIGDGIAQTSATAAAAGAAVTANKSVTTTIQRFEVVGIFDATSYTFSCWLGVPAGTGTVRMRIDRSGGFLRVSLIDQDDGMQFSAWGAKLEVGASPSGDATNYGAHP